MYTHAKLVVLVCRHHESSVFNVASHREYHVVQLNQRLTSANVRYHCRQMHISSRNLSMANLVDEFRHVHLPPHYSILSEIYRDMHKEGKGESEREREGTINRHAMPWLVMSHWCVCVSVCV